MGGIELTRVENAVGKYKSSVKNRLRQQDNIGRCISIKIILLLPRQKVANR